MTAAASHAIWNNRGACGTKLRVKCLGATNRRASYPCNTKNEVIVDVVDYCPSCGGTIDLSRDAFSSIASLSAGRINIDLVVEFLAAMVGIPLVSFLFVSSPPLSLPTVIE
ncbi:EG45-like domain containing protein [Quillaja saponaria]|uniref:EG45-like domain containing protein n=1 Tax=Quillaja saponaria TaxID=32244 RepID=A0AAD7KPI5_QUISA|nr:EG45-like domain containing protein [Quillaja saponaria]